MSATNVTTYYEFPVFVGSDKPAWLVDWNGAMNAIDSAIHEAKAEADANASNISSLQSDVTSLAGSVSSQGSSITSLTQSLTSLQGTVNTITSLIGNGLPTTDDKTIIGAINELKAEIDALDPSGEGVQAENVGYDNTDSGLTATNVQDAIDELAQGGTVDADNVSYNNTDSGLTATNVQDAIDELAQGGSLSYNILKTNESVTAPVEASGAITGGEVGTITEAGTYLITFNGMCNTSSKAGYLRVSNDPNSNDPIIYMGNASIFNTSIVKTVTANSKIVVTCDSAETFNHVNCSVVKLA